MLIHRITALTDSFHAVGGLACFVLGALIAFAALKPHIYAYNISKHASGLCACLHMCTCVHTAQ